MKFYDSSFEDIHYSYALLDLHPELHSFLHSTSFQNFIFFGPPAVGKYFFSILFINPFKFFKHFSIFYDKSPFKFFISDSHYEIDFALLGCNSKTIFFELFSQIFDILSVTQHKRGFILCKNFHAIHNELLDIFYSYMQLYNDPRSVIQIRFILLTEHISFIPNNILNICKKISIKRPSDELLQRLVSTKPKKHDVIDYFSGGDTLFKSSNKQSSVIDNLSKSGTFYNPPHILSKISTKGIRNLKDLYKLQNKNKDNLHLPKDIFYLICDIIIKEIVCYENIKIALFRDAIYDILIYNLDIYECIWYIIQYFIKEPKLALNEIQTAAILKNTILFFKYYNNNYRPIYHLENIIFSIIKIVHNIEPE